MKYGQRVRITSGFYVGLEGYLCHAGASNVGDETDVYMVAMDESELGLLTFSVDNMEILASGIKGNSPNSNDNTKDDSK